MYDTAAALSFVRRAVYLAALRARRRRSERRRAEKAIPISTLFRPFRSPLSVVVRVSRAGAWHHLPTVAGNSSRGVVSFFIRVSSVQMFTTPMTNTLNLVGRQGAIFTNCFVASPICCPNRASILTGRYQHNHLTVNNSIAGGCSNARWQQSREPATFAALLRFAGYKTFYAGKYLNQYGNEKVGGAAHVPTGWDWWAGLIGNSKYYDYSLSINGTERKYGNSSSDYLTDVISNLAVDFIKGHFADQPFLMVLAPPAPHAPFTPADRHNGKYNGTKAKRTPNFNVPIHKDKHWLVKEGPTPLPDDILPKLDEIYRRRWEALLAVDELVKNVHNLLEERNLLKDTYFIYTSDNGYHIGQFSMPMDKRQPYETDIRVPLLISGPGIEPSTIAAPVSSVDIFATLLNIADVKYPSDGTTLFDTNHNLPQDRTVLIEYRGERSNKPSSSGCPSDGDLNVTLCMKEMACKCQDAANNTFSCIRRVSPSFNNIFCIFEDDQLFIEAYDMNADEYQMTNIGYTMKKGLRHRFRKRLKRMAVCQDEQCVFTGMESGSANNIHSINVGRWNAQ
ncbi:N-acetylglucosamine-6-sulfatase isoform X2 [Monomorium pharaonis]|uniref:N-acetylglucosamine-6-sulfatase isoform X2 n=1 Tax=Monomorium pharaonis TaxID=307658 RepID=UPI0017467139|nr:N-acetylglucosamine-6-sulfatase isoform X2 [Monomorium pharaonis]